MTGPPKKKSKAVSLDVVAGEPIMVAIGGQEYEASPITLADIGAFKSMIKKRNICDVLDASSTKNPYERNDLISKMGRGSLTTEDFTSELQSPENMLWFIKRSLSKRHPDVARNGALDSLTMGEVESLAAVISSIFVAEETAEATNKSDIN